MTIGVTDYKPGPGYQFRKVRKGRRVIGEIRKYPVGLIIFVAKRRPDEIHYHLDAWGFDMEVMSMLRTYVVQVVEIEVSNGDRYVCRVEDITNTGIGAQLITAPKKLGAMKQWFLPRNAFARKTNEAGGLKLLALPKRA